MSAQQPVQTELLMRHHQLQSRLATLKIENEEVRLDLMLKNKADLLSVSVFVRLYQKTACSVNISLKFSPFGLFGLLMSVKVIHFKSSL